MSTPRQPRVFISATSGDLASVRQIVKDALLNIDCHPVEQTNFPPDARTVAAMLRGKIESCQAVIHIAGMRYGAEPEPPADPRRSYTQLEYDIARELQSQRGDTRFRVYTFICPDDFPYDTAAPAETDEKTELQRAHRTALFDNAHLYERPTDADSLKERILALQENVLALRAEEDRRHRSILRLAALIILILGGIAYGILAITKKTDRIEASQTALATRIDRDKLIERTLAAYQERFRSLRENSKDLPNKTLDAMVRAELPGILKTDAPTIKSILEEEAPRLAAALDTPIEKKLAALFVMGRYETVIEEGEKKIAQPAIASLQTMGDAARALFDKTPDKKHLQTALRYYTGAAALVDKDKAPLEWADIQVWSGRVLHDLARFKEEELVVREVAEIRKRELGENSPSYAASINNLAHLLQATNRLGEAEPLMRRALAIFETSFGNDHPELAISLNNLALSLQATNRLDEAEHLMRRALTIDEASVGKNHPYVARDLSNLAHLLQTINRPSDAEPLMRRALAIDEASVGKDHPNVAIRLNNLAQLLQATNRLDEAEPLMRRALAISETSFGKDHPDVATLINNLAGLLQATNRLGEAEPLMRRALAIFESSLGEGHPNVATQLNNLAQLLKATNRIDQAEPLIRRALAIDEVSYGKDHPKVTIDLNNLALLLQDTNRIGEAEPLMRRMVEILMKFTRDTGHQHPNLMTVVKNYYSLLIAMGDTDDVALEKIGALKKSNGASK